MGLEYHPIANIFPLIEGEALQKLVSDIKQQGLLEPLLIFEGKILDGRNRYRACQIAGVESKYKKFEGSPEEAISRVWSLNIPRRHLTSEQRACSDALRNKLLDSYAAIREAAKARQKASLPTEGQKGFQRVEIEISTHKPTPETATGETTKPPPTREARAKAAGTNPAYISEADRLLREEPEVFAQVQKGEKRLNQIRNERIEAARATEIEQPIKAEKVPAIVSDKTGVAITLKACIKCAEIGRPLAYPEIAKLTGYTFSSVGKFILRCGFIPWLKIEVISPAGDRQRRDYERRYLFSIDYQLKAICDGEMARPSLGLRSPSEFIRLLRDEISRRRHEAGDRRKSRVWNPESINKLEQSELLDYIEDELAKYPATMPTGQKEDNRDREEISRATPINQRASR
jgi:hypothetical protein